MRALLAVLLLAFSSMGFTQGFTDNSSGNPFGADAPAIEFLPVEEAYKLSVEIQPDQSIALYWQIEDSYYLYQHRFKFELSDTDGAIDLTLDYPPALERTDEYFGDVSVYYREALVNIAPSRTTGQAVLRVSSQGCADAGLCYPPNQQDFELNFDSGHVEEVADFKPAAKITTGSQKSSTPQSFGYLLYMMLLAFLGGSILNLMPCVFPVLSLKMLSFARTADNQAHAQSWVYAAGVVASFVLVAAILIFLQRAGEAIGWGFHLQSPGFVIAMAYVFVAMALSLSGVIELGSSIMGTGSGLAEKEGLSGSFFTGVLAVVVASPCTAPFMGTALGFAVTQPAPIALGIFASLGAGMAAPMVLLSYSKGLRTSMPKPGPWMETLKQFLAFPLYATAIWLLWVAGRQTGVNTMAVAMAGALLIGLGLWLWRYPGWRKALALACLIGAGTVAGWRGFDVTTQSVGSDNHIAWSNDALKALLADGQPVFVDVTADWCISCIANEQAVLLTDEITAAFEDQGVAYMVADWTNYDADIAAFLARHGRNGIPFYIMYFANSSREPLILPQLLTKSTVLKAISEVASSNSKLATTLQKFETN